MTGEARTILCMKWGTLYGPEYVNVLYAAAKKATENPVRFVCLTDNPAGLAPGIEHFPIPDIGLRPEHFRGGGWPKFAVFKRDLYGLTGRALFIDLDMVVLRDLDALFDRPEPLITTDMGPNWKPKHGTGAPEVGTCIFAFTLGEQQHLIDGLLADLDRIVRETRYEQTAIGVLAKTMAFWPPDWVISFKRHLRRPIGIDLVMEPKAPPASAKVLAFHGTPRPHELVRRGWWGKAPHVGRGPVSWMADYWRGNGGDAKS